PALAQNVPPTVTNPIADFTVYAATPARSIDLATVFTDPDVSNAVRMTTVLGTFDIALFGQQKPITVANFLKYVNEGRYFKFDPNNGQTASSFIHRSIPGFIIQGGGFLGTVNGGNTQIEPTAVLTFPPIQNEPGISNTRGTIAMAQFGPDANSATSQWFINLANNTPLDVRSGGMNPAGPYTVFGRVVNNGMTVVDAIAAEPRYNFSGAGPDFANLPLRNYNGSSAVQVSNLVSIPGIAQISPLAFSASSDNANVTVTVSGTKLLVGGNQVGSANITVTGTDFDGATIQDTFAVNVIAAPGRLIQLSTRMQVGIGDNALIGGFIMQGSAPKRLMIRGIGPSSGLQGALVDPILELRDGTGAIVASNDNWGDAANQQDMIDSGVAPTSATESGILLTVPSDVNNAFYTAIVRGVNNATGLGLVEVYDLDSGPGSTLLNISTRGEVNVDPNALIGGFFVGGTDSKTIVVRAIGPSLSALGVSGALADPTLEFFNGQGTKLDENNDWETSANKAQIQNSGLAPSNMKESAVLQTLAAGPYTAVVRGVNSGTGIGSVEVYQLP
ncbi:MAG TPA: peptidylprolyl isomerase, partial [Chthoniobacterales bacterium]|nr:peptidylprolyl isomerase [Chthoniobacterales bacterium]